MFKIKNILKFSLLSCLVFTFLTISTANAQVFSEGYKSSQNLQRGMLVKSLKDNPKEVEAVNRSTLSQMIGVVISKGDSPVNLYSSGKQIFVADSGTFDVLVSTENGNIKKGDYLSISSLSGIADKANPDVDLVIGRAAENFDGSKGSIATEVDSKKVNIGRIATEISIAKNPLYVNQKENNLPKSIEKIAKNIAGKQVPASRVWLALLVFIAASITSAVMVYSGVKSSLVSIGRNPLSKASIVRGLIQVVILGVLVFITGLFGVYLLLKL